MESAKRAFQEEYGRVMNYRGKRNFTQIIGEHAVRLCELSKAEKVESKRGLMSSWVNVHELNKEWIGRVCFGNERDEEFHELTKNLIHSYSECLADYVLDKKDNADWRQKLGSLLEKETKFFEALSGNKFKTKREWLMYTNSVIQMVNAVQRYGLESETFHHTAAEMIRCGVMLGQWMDISL